MRTHHFSIQEVPLIASAEVLDRMRVLRTEIDCHNYAQHVLDAPSIADADFDNLFSEMVGLEDGGNFARRQCSKNGARSRMQPRHCQAIGLVMGRLHHDGFGA
jgi:hypothetical protein